MAEDKEKERVLSVGELRTKGNEAFKNRKFYDAIKYYTQAITIQEALGNTGDLNKLYSNRAAYMQSCSFSAE